MSQQMESVTTPGVSKDARAMMMFEANKKSTFVAYLLWFFLGGLGAHRFYNGKKGSGLVQLGLLILGIVLSFVGVGLILLGVLYIWVLVDAFLIPGWIRSQNMMLASQIAGP